MQDLQKKVKKHDDRLSVIDEQMTLTNKLLCELKANSETVKDTVSALNSNTNQIQEDIKSHNSIRAVIPDYLPWILTMLAFLILAILFRNVPEWVKQSLDFATSWVATIVILISGIVAANAVRAIDKKLARWVSAGYAGIFSCYVGYIFYNYGAIDPHGAAIGFNVGTIMQNGICTAIIVMVTAACVKVLKNDSRKSS